MEKLKEVGSTSERDKMGEEMVSAEMNWQQVSPWMSVGNHHATTMGCS
jgi:hypothetical protein